MLIGLTQFPSTPDKRSLSDYRDQCSILSKLGQGYNLEPEARAVLEEEHVKIKLGLKASYTAL